MAHGSPSVTEGGSSCWCPVVAQHPSQDQDEIMLGTDSEWDLYLFPILRLEAHTTTLSFLDTGIELSPDAGMASP